jgi:predicted SAM-dependent methyltransferase
MRRILMFFFSHRTLALLRWDLHFFKLRFLNVLLFRKRRVNALLKNGTKEKYLNLGSGPRGIDDGKWINIDGFKDRNVHYLCDFNRPLPFKDETFDAIFCEHVLEHFDYENGKNLMKECLRVLKKNGVIRIVVPDGYIILNAYFREPEFIVKYKECQTNNPMEAVNAWFYQRYEHQCIYDGAYLVDMLLSTEFASAKKVGYSQGVAGKKEIILDDPKYSWESLYVEAVK